MSTRRVAGTWNPACEEPEARARARLATSNDLPTFGSPPTKRMPLEGSNPGSISEGVGVGLCSSNWPNDTTPAVEERLPASDVGFIAKPPEWRPAIWVHRWWMLCGKRPDATRSARVYSPFEECLS